MTDLHLEELDFILAQYGGGLFPFQMCPPHLFAEIVKINYLRMRATALEFRRAEELSQLAYEMLGRIDDFSPTQWAESKFSSKEEWMLLGDIFQAAVALYCILSLQSLSILPISPSLRARCTMHGHLLQVLLNKALQSPSLKRFLLWPLVLLGVEAVNGDLAMRAFVVKQLPEMSRHFGTYVPLTAKEVLERFWASGETRWDVCFERPYAFTMQIAVDLSQLSPLF
jgi:hypothetical protein